MMIKTWLLVLKQAQQCLQAVQSTSTYFHSILIQKSRVWMLRNICCKIFLGLHATEDVSKLICIKMTETWKP